MQHLIVQYYSSTILNSATIAIAVTTSTTTSSALSKGRTLVQYWNGATLNSATSQSATFICSNIKKLYHQTVQHQIVKY